MEENKNIKPEENEEGNGENNEENGEGYGKWDAMSDIFTNKDFIATIERLVDKIINAIQQGSLKEKEKYKEFEKSRRIFLWQRFVLSIMVIIYLGLAADLKWLSSESIVPLLAAAIGSLFWIPKKD